MIENNHIPKRKKRRLNKKRVACAVAVLLITVAAVSVCSSCLAEADDEVPQPVEAVETFIRSESQTFPEIKIIDPVTVSAKESTEAPTELTISSVPWSEKDVELLALTLAGECYANEEDDKRIVCEVILNRVSDDLFKGSTIYEVVSCTKFGVQFKGYWQQSRPVTDNDKAIAEEMLHNWYANDCNPLSEYRFFYAGDDHKNVFS